MSTYGPTIALFVLTRAVLAVLGLSLLIAMGRPHTLEALVVHWDAVYYLAIAGHGYPLPSQPGWLAIWGFLPLYPLLIWLVHLPLVGLVPQSYLVAGLLLANGCSLTACLLLRRELAGYSTELADRAVAVLLLFPTTVFLSVPYTEGLFLLLSVGAFALFRRQRYFLAGVACGLATVERSQGALLVLALVAALLLPILLQRARSGDQSLQHMVRRALMPSIALLVPTMLTLGVYITYSMAQIGLPLPFETAQTQAFGHRLTPFVYPLVRYLLAPTLVVGWDWRVVNFAVAILALAAVVPVYRRFGAAWGIWLAISVLAALSNNGHYMDGLTRYLLVAFPLHAGLAAWAKHPLVERLLFGAGALLAGAWVLLFILNLPLAA